MLVYNPNPPLFSLQLNLPTSIGVRRFSGYNRHFLTSEKGYSCVLG